MTNTAKITKALRSAGYQVTTDMPGTVQVKKTRFKEETSVTVRYLSFGNWNSTTDWRVKNTELTASLIALGFDAILTENNGIEVSFATKVGA